MYGTGGDLEEKAPDHREGDVFNVTEASTTGAYDGAYTGRCLGQHNQYPVGSAGGSWSAAIRTLAEDWCDARSDCHGFMHWDSSVGYSLCPTYIAHTGACRDWCGKPQF